MKNYIITAIAIIALLTSCRPYRHLATSSGTRDSVRVETVTRTEYVTDTVFLEVPREVIRQTVRDTASHLETSLAISDARLNADGMLFHSLENKPGKRPVEVKKEVVYRDSIVYRDREVKVENIVEVERELTWWQKTQIHGFRALLVLLVVMYRKKILAIVKLFV